VVRDFGLTTNADVRPTHRPIGLGFRLDLDVGFAFNDRGLGLGLKTFVSNVVQN